MPLSSKRKKNPVPLAGIPRPVIRRAPHGWPPEKTARWCRAFLVGAASVSGPEPMPKFERYERAAFLEGSRAKGTDRLQHVLGSFWGNARLGRLA